MRSALLAFFISFAFTTATRTTTHHRTFVMSPTAAFQLIPRRGPKPNTTNKLPHSQLDGHGPEYIAKKLHDYCFSTWPGQVVSEQSGISVPGARAMVLHRDCQCHSNKNAFMVGREFAHIHPYPDLGSMHLTLSPKDAKYVIDQGWGEDHYLVSQGHWAKGLVMIFSPRDDDELEQLKAIVARSFEFATGSSSSSS